MKLRNTRRAFTLIELLLVLVILAVLAAVVIPNLTGRVEQARRTGTITEINNLCGAMKNFEIDNGRFPTSGEGLQALVEKPADLPNWTHKYIDEVPLDKWGRPYLYQGPDTVGDEEEFQIISTGRSGELGNPDNINKYTK
jgi:general secretion pathway protein G